MDANDSNAGRDLESFPEIGSRIESLAFAGYRELIVGNYRVINRILDDKCEIVAIFRAEQDIDRAFGSVAPT